MGTLTRTAYELRGLLQRHPDGCVMCRFAYAGVRARIDAMFYEQVTDRDVRSAIRASRGFCPRHSRMVSEYGDALGAALIMQDVLINELRDIEDGKYAPTRAGGPFSRFLESKSATPALCPLCAAQDELDRVGTSALMEGLADGELDGPFRASAGLCLPHLRLGQSHVTDETAWTIVLDTERQRLQSLADTLGSLARKSDYRFRDEEVSPEEATSWRRALALTSGMEEGV